MRNSFLKIGLGALLLGVPVFITTPAVAASFCGSSVVSAFSSKMCDIRYIDGSRDVFGPLTNDRMVQLCLAVCRDPNSPQSESGRQRAEYQQRIWERKTSFGQDTPYSGRPMGSNPGAVDPGGKPTDGSPLSDGKFDVSSTQNRTSPSMFDAYYLLPYSENQRGSQNYLKDWKNNN